MPVTRKILVTGATGLVGRALVKRLRQEGHEVRALSRRPETLEGLQAFAWNHRQVAPPEAFKGVHAVIHLAGEGIADRRWTKARKRALQESRTLGTRNLVAGIAQLSDRERPRVLLSASGIGYYGNTEDRNVDESAQPGSDFLSGICRGWEEAARSARDLGLRVAIFRLGMVLAPDGGALAKMGPGIVGDGRQWISWVHREDVLRFLLFALDDERVRGEFNLVSPSPVRHAEFMRAFARVRRYPFLAPVPAFALKLALGELSSLVLEGQKVQPSRLKELGFEFRFPELEGALAELAF